MIVFLIIRNKELEEEQRDLPSETVDKPSMESYVMIYVA